MSASIPPSPQETGPDAASRTEESAPRSSGRFSIPWKRVAGLQRRLLQTLFALAPLVLLAVGVPPALAVIPAIYPFFILIRRGINRVRRRISKTSLEGEQTIRMLLSLLPLAVCWAQPGTGAAGWVSAALLALVPLAEPVVVRVAPGRKLRIANLPDVPDHRGPAIPVNSVLLVDVIAVALATALLLVGVPGGATMPIPLVALLLAGFLALDSFRRVRESVNADNALYGAVDAYQPRFILYYGVPTGSEYQVEMWMRYLERIGEPFIVVLRHRSTFRKIRKMTEAPVIVRTSMRQLDDIVVPSITTAFFVNNGALNAHMVRYPQITHVQLLHGDSDKATSYNPITGMFDKIFVAGQAGIDRYADNGVNIPLEKFTIVGRPQVESVELQSPSAPHAKTVLYAPTWEGHFADTNYGSLPVGPQIVRALVERGCTVVFRPHPYSYKNPVGLERIREIKRILQEDAEANGREHLYGRAAEKDLDAFGCFNAADAMISDVSSVVPDFLYSGKPYALVSMSFEIEEFLRMFPLARSAYVMPRDLSNIDQALDELLVTDSKAQQRRQTREYYLGPFPAEHYADAFVDAARNVILHEQKSTDAQHARTSEADEGGDGELEAAGEQGPATIAPDNGHDSALTEPDGDDIDAASGAEDEED